jgi:diguanylate cyclase (GGDEF)-like protein/putative nucleotidyltransferase with HDIG domain
MGSPQSSRTPGQRLGDHGLHWRVLACSYVVAAIMAFLSVAGPHDGPHEGTITVLAVLSALTGAAMLAVRRPVHRAVIPVMLVCGAGLLGVAVYIAGDPTTPYAILIVWTGANAFFFLPRWGASLVMVAVAAGYAAILHANAHPASDETARWVMTVGTTLTVSVLACLLRAYGIRLHGEVEAAATRDPLTGVRNRQGFEEALAIEVERALRTGRPVSVVIADLDGLAAINRRQGRTHGDRAIRGFVELARQRSRRIDVIARVGGDEVALVLPESDEYGGLLMAERLRRGVREQRETPAAVEPLGLSASVGIATFPKHAGTADALLDAAEQALGAAKHLGRDRCVVYSPEVTGDLPRDAALQAHGSEHLAAVLVLAETLDLRDAGTALHSQTVAGYAEAIARNLGLDDDHVERVRIAGLLHDIGKVGVPDGILLKPGRLTDAEMDEIRKHPEIGARIIAGANLDDISGWVLAHHERPDGRGYPLGLTGESIPLEARILAVADSFEAMTADRVYRAAMPRAAAVEQLRACEGSQFDPRVVAAFLEVLEAESADDPSAGVAA